MRLGSLVLTAAGETSMRFCELAEKIARFLSMKSMGSILVMKNR